VVVPLLVRRFGLTKDTIPLAMFGALACVFVVTWHKGAIIRAFLRAVVGAPAAVQVPQRIAQAPAASRQRVDVGDAGKVRVHAGELAPEELLGQTELPPRDARPARVANRA
jgi:hypothetical protein